ncbi:low-affinity phosphate transporter [Polyrhizophydium stewartii]|uniref:Low-affinity phosphate transporter n=1 Tax=Polyrhizophydium stewartii TaxID=2732419 RepID=A0ABR4N1Z8_9FUNG
MKFSRSIELNASPEWRDYYLAYSHLKKLIYAIEKATLGLAPLPDDHHDIYAAAPTTPRERTAGAALPGDAPGATTDDDDEESQPLLSASMTASAAGGPSSHRRLSLAEANEFFQRALDEELDKIKSFYINKELDLVADVQALINEIKSVEKYEENYLAGLSDALEDPRLPSLQLVSPALPPPGTLLRPHDAALAALAGATDSSIESAAFVPTEPGAPGGPAVVSPLSAVTSEPSPVARANAGLASQAARNLVHAAAADGLPLRANSLPPHATAATASAPAFAHRGSIASEHRRAYSENVEELSGVSGDPGRPGYLPILIWSSKGLRNHRQKFQKRAIGLFVVLCELRDYVEIHETGFSKVLKKYEKVVGAKLKSTYMAKVEAAHPFLARTKENLSRTIDQVISIYSRIATDGKTRLALTELKSHLREHIVWERNTIWRDMIEQERRRETIGLRTPAIASDPLSASKLVPIRVCGWTLFLPSVIPTNFFVILFAFVVLIAISQSELLPTPEQTGCLAILVFASILWAFEALPLFITSILVPLLVVVLRVQRKNGERLGAKDAAKQIFSDMFGPVIMLLLGGFSLAGALSKHNIAKEAAAVILGRAGTRPQWVLLANMFVSTFASMWISNVAAPVLCFSLVSPILRNLPRGSRYARCLVIGIAMAANVGGMASPIASPQNIIAMANMNPAPSWLQWFMISLPVCFVIDACIWAFLLMVYKPDEAAAPPELYGQEHFSTPKLTGTQVYILLVTIVTIGLWCIESSIEGIVGDMGVIAIVPIVAFYGTGILTKDDWNSMLWSVVMLAMGGIALGKAVDSSGLLALITSRLSPFLQQLPMFYCAALLTGVVVVVTSFISHTVGALIILPVVAQIGAALPDPRPRTLVMASALLCSGGMALPVSSFPNMNAISLEDPTGVPWLKVADFLRVGVVSTGVAWVAVMSIGYAIMTMIEFK